MAENTLIIGIGNDYRSDDAVARAVARKLTTASLDGVRVEEEGGEGAALIEAWPEADLVVLIDAARSGAEPGTITRIDAHEKEIPDALLRLHPHLQRCRSRRTGSQPVARAIGLLRHRGKDLCLGYWFVSGDPKSCRGNS